MSWMNWTLPTIISLCGLAAAITSIAVYEIFNPPVERKGFLPIPTTPGDRLFISILTIVGIFFLYMAFFGEGNIWIACVINIILVLLIAVKG
ncbi:MAG TPA: DUF2160 family membrane protein [Thermotogota bacterium]|nr:DUF2160 family membrane protein [Thermotogota bacterium]